MSKQSAPPVSVNFSTTYAPPKGQEVMLLVLGDIPELGTYKMDKRFRLKFETKINRALRRYREHIQNSGRRKDIHQRYSEEQDLDNYESDHDSADEGSSGGRLYQDESEFFQDYPAELLRDFLKKSFIVLENDPDSESEIRDYWAMEESIKLKSISNGKSFKYCMVVWSITKNMLWDIEKFRQPRHITIPPLNQIENPENKWMIFAEKFNNKDHTNINADVPEKYTTSYEPLNQARPGGGRDPYLDDEFDDEFY